MRSVLAGRHVALGLLPLAIEGRPDAGDGMATIRAAIDAGVRVVDTADVYGRTGEPPGYAERLLAPILRDSRCSHVVVATKGGLVSLADGTRVPRGEPAHLRAACEASIQRLGVDAVDVYQLHRPDPAVAFEDSVGALVDLVDRGLARAVGVSNVAPEQLAVARRVAGDRLVAVQNRLAPDMPAAGDARGTLPESARHGLTYLAWGIFGGTDDAPSLAVRWPAGARVALARGVSVHRMAVGWALALGAVPVVGARRASSIIDAAAAIDLDLSRAELDELAGIGAGGQHASISQVNG